jgi:hypothetical protein
LKRGGASEVVLSDGEMTTKTVCHDCNTGWMSRLEGQVKPILEPMFDGNPVTLDTNQQQLIAVWMTKMAFVWDSTKGRNADNGFYRRSDGAALAQSYQIPNFTTVWTGSIGEEHRSADGADFTLNSPERVSGGSCVTVTNEHFVAQIVSLRLKETPIGPTILGLDPKPGDWDNMLIQICPPGKPIVRWPPKISFTNGGPGGYAFLMDRWRVGSFTEKIIHR